MTAKNILLYSSSIVLFFYCGCGLVVPALNPVTNEDRVVHQVDDNQKTVIFNRPMVWYDSIQKTRGILFPQGIYKLEAEDDEYYYFTAPEQLEYRIFEKGEPTDIRFMPGGLFMAKRLLNMVPAGAYLSVSESNKTLTWKLGSDFLRMEGHEWEKTY